MWDSGSVAESADNGTAARRQGKHAPDTFSVYTISGQAITDYPHKRTKQSRKTPAHPLTHPLTTVYPPTTAYVNWFIVAVNQSLILKHPKFAESGCQMTLISSRIMANIGDLYIKKFI